MSLIRVAPLFLMATLSAGIVIFSSNPVVATLALVFLILMSSCLLIILGVEFLGISLIVLYLGAVAVLFFFVLMLLNQRVWEATKMAGGLPVGGGCAAIKLVHTGVLVNFAANSRHSVGGGQNSIFVGEGSRLEWVEQLGGHLYISQQGALWGSGLVLLITMIAAIMVGLNHQRHILRQDLRLQSTIEMESRWIR